VRSWEAAGDVAGAADAGAAGCTLLAHADARMTRDPMKRGVLAKTLPRRIAVLSGGA
jgi:hypothetical protein